MQGKVKFFSDEKGWGFITPHNWSTEVFVHYSAIQMAGRKKLTEGQEVEFEIEVSDRGQRAIAVKCL